MSYYNPTMNQMMNPMGGPDDDDAPKGMKWATFIFLIFTFLLALVAMGVGIIELINNESDGDPRLLPFNPMGPKPEIISGGQLLKVNKSYYWYSLSADIDLLIPNNANKGDYINLVIRCPDQGGVGIRTTDDGKTFSNRPNFSKTSYIIANKENNKQVLFNNSKQHPGVYPGFSAIFYFIYDGKQWNFKGEVLNQNSSQNGVYLGN